MPLYHLNLINSGVLIADEEGSELPDLAAAHAEAIGAARQLWAAAILAGRDLPGHSFEITDDSGQLCLSISLDDALPARLRVNTNDEIG